MKKSSKVLSLVLAVLMAVSCFSGLTIFSASAEETDTKIYFDASNLLQSGEQQRQYIVTFTL